MEDQEKEVSSLLLMTTDIVSAYVQKNSVSSSHVPELVRSVYDALNGAGKATVEASKSLVPAVAVKKSVHPDYIICLEDGKKLKVLKRHLRARYNLSPDQYRAKWGLSADYPMVAPNYASKRSEFAKKIGLGRGGEISKK